MRIRDKALNFLRSIYQKVFLIDDTPVKIALGFGLGVLSGIIPGMGPIAALFLAIVFHANRASAILGSVITNTWASILTFFLSIKLGSAIIGLSWLEAYQDWQELLKHFSFSGLLRSNVLKAILALLTGYLVIALALGLVAYLLTLILIRIKNAYQNRTHLPR